MADSLAFKVLQALNIAVLERTGPGAYKLLGDPPLFYTRLFPATAEGHCSSPWDHSAMLEFFRDTAEEFFATGECGQVSSGTWEEEYLCEGNEALNAEAMSFNGSQVIIVRLLKNDYTERTALLRKAREHLLDRRLLKNDLEMYKIKSRTDGLTKVLNRTAFMELFAAQINQTEQTNQSLALIMIDIDNFKQINDTYGHQSGDRVLAGLGQILLSSLRRNDVVARYGGEEFIILLPYTPREQLLRIAEKLRKNVERHSFEGIPINITVSLGCASYRLGEDMAALIERADSALYDSKRNGKNRVQEH
ncbi:MAG: GGDEF domain-containing protein [Desulfovibrio sp.]|jgi:diguanylate cyclase|nr:GGDEF domain-containing protein [Desulfovibrio sp.]